MSWAHYILQVNIYLIVFYGFYKLLLDKETYFFLNRIYLVSSAILSLSIPFLRFEWFASQSATRPVYQGASQLNDLMTQVIVAENAPERFSMGNIIVLVYFSGIVFCSILFIYRLFAVYQLFKKPVSGNAFSFFNKKRIDQELPDIDTIHRHEDIHIRQYHTLDVLFFELLNIFIWFNPVIYFYKRTIKNIHEYLADEKAAAFQGDKTEYALLLLSKAFGVDPNGLTNTFFNKSLIKKRIFMLHKQRSKRTAILKYGLFLPLFAITLVMSSATIRNNEKIIAVTEEIPLNNPLNVVKEVTATKTTAVSFADPAWDKFYAFLQKSIRYPSAAKEANVQGNSQIRFNLEKGQPQNISIVHKLGEGCDAEIVKALLNYKDFKSVPDGNYSLQVTFKLDGSGSPMKNPKILPVKNYKTLNQVVIMTYGINKESNIVTADLPLDKNDLKVYDFVSVDQQPSFKGGMEVFYRYLKHSMKYPEKAKNNKVEGKVFLSFVVEKDGGLSEINVVKALGAGTDEEAIRILKESPKWIPGVLNGHAVRVKYHIPITFSLTKQEDATGEKTGKISLDVSPQNKALSIDSDKKPLYILDGKKISDLTGIDPHQIDNIVVMKDKNAINTYGDEGINGVVVVTTKAEANRKKTEN